MAKAKPQKAAAAPGKDILHREISLGGVSLVEKAVFAKNLAVMLRAGLTINNALAISQSQAHGRLRHIIKDLRRDVEAGNSLSDALAVHKKVFSGFFIQMVTVGESSGTLDEALETIATQLEKEHALATKITGAMIYPMIILVSGFLLGLFMAFFVFPKIIPLFKGLNIPLPFTTRALIAVSDIIASYGTLLLILIAIIIVGLIWFVNTAPAKPLTHWLLLRVPVIKNISKNANLARFCRTMGSMLKSGVVIEQALYIAKDTVGNYYYKNSVGKVAQRITTGAKLSGNLREFKALYPEIVVEMINVGEQSGKLSDVLLYLADYYDLEVDTATRALTTFIEPLLLVVIGGGVGLLALAIITPIYELTGNIGR